MKNTPTRVRAAAVNAVSKGNPVLAFTTQDADLLSAASVVDRINASSLAEHECDRCGTKVYASTHVAPFCQCCGTDKMTATRRKVLSSGHTHDKTLAGVQCTHCKANNIVSARVLASLGSSIHCTDCGTSLRAKAAAVPDQGDPVLDPPVMDGQPTPELKHDPKESLEQGPVETKADAMDDVPAQDANDFDDLQDLVTSEGDWPFTETSAEGDDAEEEKEEAADADTNDDGKVDKDEVKKSFEENKAPPFGKKDGDKEEKKEESDFEDEFGLSSDDDMLLDEGLSASEAMGLPSTEVPGIESTGMGLLLEPTDAPGAEQRIMPENDMALADTDPFDMPESATGEPVMESAGFDDTVQACALIAQGRKTLLLKGHTVIASLTPERAGSNAKVMQTEAFAEAFLETASQKGLRKALASFGFAPIRTKTLTPASVKAQVQAVKASVQREQAAAQKVQADCFAIAAVGLARGMWKGDPNPLKVAIERELSALGVRKPGAVAANLLATAGIEYSQALCERASKLSTLTPETRKELAETLDMVSDQPIQDLMTAEQASVDSDDSQGEDIPNTVQARLHMPGTPQVPALLRSRESATADSPRPRLFSHL